MSLSNPADNFKSLLFSTQQESGVAVGLDLMTGEPMLPEQEGVWDNYCVKRQSLHLSTVSIITRAYLAERILWSYWGCSVSQHGQQHKKDLYAGSRAYLVVILGCVA